MPTLMAALTLPALLKLAHIDFPRWHLAFWFGLLVGLALRGHLPLGEAALNGLGSFAAAWAYFVALERTDHRAARLAHWAILVGGFALLVGTRLLLDIRHYGIRF
ncbi:MAG: response regulator [Burkholderiaceae bacterium]